jgi:hypothetical protein
VETLTASKPASAVAAPDPAWDEAFLRVESYLRAHHIESRTLLNGLATMLIAKARQVAATQPGDEPVTVAMQVTNAEIGAWFARVLGEGDWSDERFRARGRLALLLTNLAEKYPHYFLSSEPLPADLAAAMRACTFQPGPEVRFSHMPPTPLDEIMGDASDPTRAPSAPRSLLRAACTWLILAGAIGFAWVSSH